MLPRKLFNGFFVSGILGEWRGGCHKESSQLPDHRIIRIFAKDHRKQESQNRFVQFNLVTDSV